MGGLGRDAWVGATENGPTVRVATLLGSFTALSDE